MLKKAISVFTVLIGVVMIVLGVVLFAQRADTEINAPKEYTVSAKGFRVEDADVTTGGGSFSVSSARFGADFYTYIYRGVVEAVDALDKICVQLKQASYADQAIYNAIQTSVSAQGAIYSALSQGLKATDQLSEIMYESAVEQSRKLTMQSAVILLCSGAAVLVFGLYCVGSNFAVERPEKAAAPLLIEPAKAARAEAEPEEERPEAQE